MTPVQLDEKVGGGGEGVVFITNAGNFVREFGDKAHVPWNGRSSLSRILSSTMAARSSCWSNNWPRQRASRRIKLAASVFIASAIISPRVTTAWKREFVFRARGRWRASKRIK